MLKLGRVLVLAALVVVLLGWRVATTRADNPRSITVMTQNLYQGTEFTHTLTATTQQQFLAGVAADYSNVVATNFPQRADALATEIARARPALLGLQEVALWETQSPYPTGPWSVSYDFLAILVKRLAAHGMAYAPVTSPLVDFTVAGAGLFPSGLMGVRLTEQAVILARTDLAPDHLQLTNAQKSLYQAAITLPSFAGPVTLHSGWLSVDATSRGRTFRFITTHLSALTLTSGVQAQQAQELLAGPAATTLPVVIAGDFNSTPTDPAYLSTVGAGFTDAWTAVQEGEPGATAFQVLPSITNPVSTLSVRIDYVFVRGSLAAEEAQLVGATPSARTASGLWPSDHAGLVVRLRLGRCGDGQGPQQEAAARECEHHADD